MQQGLLFHSLLAPASGAYVPQIILTLKGVLDSKYMAAAWQQTIDRHGALRTGYSWEKRDEPFQVVFRKITIDFVEQDWRNLDSNAQKMRLKTLLAANRSEPFKLQRPPLMRLFLVQLGNDRTHLVWCYHHLVLDGWSAAIVLQEVMHHYNASVQSADQQLATPRPYADYIAWLKQQDTSAALAYWRKTLKDLPALPTLPLRQGTHTLFGKQAVGRPYHIELALSTKETQQVEQFIRSHKVTLNTLMQGALGLLLRRYGNDGNIVFGTTVSGRPATLEQATHMVGLFINSIPVRLNINPEIPVGVWLTDIQNQQQCSAEHDYLSLRELQAECNQNQAMFNSLLVFESYPSGSTPEEGLLAKNSALQLEQLSFDESTHLPLTLQVAEGPQLRLGARVDLRLFTSATIERLLNHFKTLVLKISTQPNSPIAQISMLSTQEQSQRTLWNQTSAPWPKHATLADLIEQQVIKTPNSCALVFEQQTLNYRELNSQANQLAYVLQSQVKNTANAFIAVHMDRSLNLLIALLAIQKTGAAHLCLELNQPEQRLHDIIEDAKPALIIYDSASTNKSSETVPLLDINDVAIDQTITNNPGRSNGPKSPAYLIYTSGSTGRPKGVINTQAGIVNRLHWMQSYLQLTAQDRVLQKTPLSFDVSVWELFWPLINGATLVIAKPEVHLNREKLADLIEHQKISVLHFVPTMLSDFLASDSFKSSTYHQKLPQLREVVCSGETLSSELQKRFFDTFPNTQLHNLYGPTEAAIDVTAWQCDPDEHEAPIPIGKPIDNMQIHILDADDFEVPVGAPGQLFIAGVGVAQGYLNRSQLDQESFLSNSLSSSEHNRTLYKSGDLACYRDNGVIDYLGRNDEQIKLRGVRIELGEIENSLKELDNIKDAMVKFWKNLPIGSQLVAYLVFNRKIDDQTQNLTKALRLKLPNAMIPSSFVTLNTLPQSSSGKPDRKQLPPPQTIKSHHIPPKTPNEILLARIWHDSLGLGSLEEEVNLGIEDNFFELGGHSLVATRIVNRIRQECDLELPLPYIFEYPSLGTLAEQLDIIQDQQNKAANTQEITI